MALKITTQKIKKLKPHPKNMRLHDTANIAAIMRSLEEFGQRTPLVVWKKKQVIKGCGTLEAMKRLKWKECQVVSATELSEPKALAYAIADNKTTDMSEFDFEAVGLLMHELQDKIDLTTTGFQEHEIEPLMQADWEPPEEEELEGLGGAGASLKEVVEFTTQEQLDTVKGAVALVREYEDFAECTMAEALVAICEEYEG